MLDFYVLSFSPGLRTHYGGGRGMDSFFPIDTKNVCLMLQLLFPVTLVWETTVSFIAHATRPWRELFWLCFEIYLNLWTGIGSFTLKMLLLPLRIYNAIQREDMVCHLSPFYENSSFRAPCSFWFNSSFRDS
jgi:hypothetical protein